MSHSKSVLQSLNGVLIKPATTEPFRIVEIRKPYPSYVDWSEFEHTGKIPPGTDYKMVHAWRDQNAGTLDQDWSWFTTSKVILKDSQMITLLNLTF